MAKLSASLPDGERNGLIALTGELTDNPHKNQVVIAVINCKSISTDVDTGAVVPTARILRIDPLLAEDYKRAEQLMRRSLERRNGGETLPIDIEDDIQAIFSAITNDEASEGDK